MAPRSEKKKKALEEKLRKEQEALEKKIELYRQAKKLNYIRLALLKETYKIFDGFSRGLAKIFAVKEQKYSWNRYISCTKFPHAHQPAALRSFLSTWQIQIQEDLSKYFDWLLNVDERTVLSQKIDRIDLTADSIRSKQPNFAEPFAKGANDAITVLTDIEDVLNRPEYYQCTEKCINELLQIKDDFRAYLWNTLDIMTYMTIGNIERDMIAIDATSAEYQYKSDVFAIGLYSNREVPQPRMRDRTDILYIRFDSISASIKCPKHITFDESALRGLWFSYDHYSDQARSYKIPNYIPSLENLLESCRLETEEKERLENDNIERMKRDRAKYDETIVDEKPQSNEETNKPKPKRGRRGEISVKMMEPPKVDEETVVDVTAEYMELENLRSKERLGLLHPDEIQLQPNELNLRKYTILGGIYAIHYLEKPTQSVKFDNHLFLRNIEKPVTLKYRPYNQPYRPIEFPSDCVLSEFDQADIRRKDNVRFNQLIEVSVQLTADIFWWEEPVVCRWQPWEESEAFMKLPDDLRDYNLNYDQIMETKSSRLWNSIQNEKVSCEPIALEDFDLNGSRHGAHLAYLIGNHLLSRLSVTYRFESELKEVEEKLAAEIKRRQHLQREHEEDLRLEATERAEAKKIRGEQRAARKAERAARILEQQENEEESAYEESFVSSSSTSSSEEAMVGENVTSNSNPNGDGLITFKSVVEGTAARELFPFLEKCTELKIMRPKRSEFRWSLLNADLSTKPDIDMLSSLLERIQQYNLKEQPIFGEQSSAMATSHTKKNAITQSKSNAIKRKGKRGTVADLQSTVKHQCQGIEMGWVWYAPLDVKVNRIWEGMVTAFLKAATQFQSHLRIEMKLVPHNKGNWITSGIFLQNFDPIERIVTFKTSEIGVFGFAVCKYFQFPISDWEVRPNHEKSMTTIIVVTGRTVSIEILVTVSGYRLTITKPIPKKCPIKVPTNTMSLKQLIQFLREHNMNFFPELDAFWYINGMSNVKHDAMCNHTYLCIGHFCQTHQFRRSAWNVLANRREAIVLSRQIIENRAAEQFVEVKITPHDAYIVRVEELCTSLDEVSLFHHLTPPDQEFNCDLFSLLTAQSIDKSKNKQQNTSIRLKSNVSELLMALQLFSYST